MEDKVKAFLESGRLEEYIYGALDSKGQQEVIDYIKKYPEVNKEYLILQEQLENVASQQAIKAPTGMKSQIMESLPDKSLPQSMTMNSWPSYLAILGLAASLLFVWLWQNTDSQLQKEKENYALLASECEQREKQIEAQLGQIAFLNSPQTRRFEMQGNQLAADFKAIVFVNEDKAIVSPFTEVNLAKNKCLQLWGDLEGEMIPIAVLNEVSIKDYEVKINPNFTSLNFTIEEKTADGKGQDHPDVSQLIASVTI